MRSEYVFAAVREVSNRFLLCRVASASARRLHQGAMPETINKSLKLIAGDGRKAREAAVNGDRLPTPAGQPLEEADTRSAIDGTNVVE